MTPGLIRLRVLLGPRDDWFTNPSVLGDGRWQVSDDSDRVGLRVIRPGDPVSFAVVTVGVRENAPWW